MMPLDMSEHGLALFGIPGAGDEAGRLVKQKQPRALALRQRRAVHGDCIALAHVEGGAREHAPVDGDATFRDPLLGVAPRTGAGPRHRLGDALALEGLFARFNWGGPLGLGGARLVGGGFFETRLVFARRLVGLVTTAYWRGGVAGSSAHWPLAALHGRAGPSWFFIAHAL